MDDMDDVALSADTLKILNEFLNEQKQKEESSTTATGLFEQENWQLSQFWYSLDTQFKFGEAIRKMIESSTDGNYTIALLSCPSLYPNIKTVTDNVKIFEFDERFSSLGPDFVFYDIFNLNEVELKDYNKHFDIIIADPPFISEDCVEKLSKVVEILLKTNGKVVLNTGTIVKEHIERILHLQECQFKPEHRNNLANEFSTFSNFDFDKYII
ncbi:unnamed protein product [Diamesa hyperborea]